MTRTRTSLTLGVAVIALVALSALSAGAGLLPPDDNTVTVNKVVAGTVPVGTTFTVELSCLGSFKGGPDFTVMTFDEHGTPTSGNNVVMVPSTGSAATCTATETATGGAATVAYGCVTSGNTTLATCPDGPAGQRVRFEDVSGSSGVITVTNTFPTPVPDPAPASEVVVEPAFTG